ncbi:relaxosome protein TraM (plasmid) [Pantoea agglomerans]|uniref:relaxosome protein TraM n=1 Tax=Enterobacter agglomerans TaxID=549 RepID=UPI001786F588|nr:relaxosome protein TraM [Pantoea agglomerans]WVL92333.1 relaxosome protein TraM [Pantoea agglomerans]
MPRAQVYITQNNYKRIQAIVDAKKEDGADRTEANVSSVAAMLLDIGLRVYEFQQKKELEEGIGEGEENYDSSVVDSIAFNKILMENILKTSYASTILLQMVGSFEEMKETGLFNYDNVKKQIREKAGDELSKIFNGGDD